MIFPIEIHYGIKLKFLVKVSACRGIILYFWILSSIGGSFTQGIKLDEVEIVNSNGKFQNWKIENTQMQE